MFLKERLNSYYCVTPKNRFMSVHFTFLQITQKILTKYIFRWLELITEILSFLQIFSVRKITTPLFNLSETLPEYQQKSQIPSIFWAFKRKLQIIYAATYIALFLSDSNNCFFICLVPHIPFYLCYSLILCFYFHVLFLSFLATSHILQFTVFNLISFYSLSVILRR